MTNNKTIPLALIFIIVAGLIFAIIRQRPPSSQNTSSEANFLTTSITPTPTLTTMPTPTASPESLDTPDAFYPELTWTSGTINSKNDLPDFQYNHTNFQKLVATSDKPDITINTVSEYLDQVMTKQHWRIASELMADGPGVSQTGYIGVSNGKAREIILISQITDNNGKLCGSGGCPGLTKTTFTVYISDISIAK